jgi:hypothetical protein
LPSTSFVPFVQDICTAKLVADQRAPLTPLVEQSQPRIIHNGFGRLLDQLRVAFEISDGEAGDISGLDLR